MLEISKIAGDTYINCYCQCILPSVPHGTGASLGTGLFISSEFQILWLTGNELPSFIFAAHIRKLPTFLYWTSDDWIESSAWPDIWKKIHATTLV